MGSRGVVKYLVNERLIIRWEEYAYLIDSIKLLY